MFGMGPPPPNSWHNAGPPPLQYDTGPPPHGPHAPSQQHDLYQQQHHKQNVPYMVPQGPPPPGPYAHSQQHGLYQGQQQQQHFPQGQWGQQLRQGQVPPPQSQYYGSYGQKFSKNVFSINAAQAMGFNSDTDLEQAFNSKMSRVLTGIQGEELQQILNEIPRIKEFYKINFSLNLCKIMIAMLDRSGDGILQFVEFQELLRCLTFWHQAFIQNDANRTGFIEANEIYQVITNFGYKISHKSLTVILKRYSKAMDNGQCLIAFDDFVALCIKLRAYTEDFRARDRRCNGGKESGNAGFEYDDFLQCVLCL